MASNALPDSCLRRETLNHLRANLLSRDHFNGSGINLVQATLDFFGPCGFDFDLGEIFVRADAFPEGVREQDSLILREFAGDLSDFLEGMWHGEIVARNRSQSRILKFQLQELTRPASR